MGRGQEGATRFRCSCHKPADLHRRSRAMLEGVRAHSLRVSKADSEPVALGRSGLRNWSECTITFVCAVSEVIRSSKTCICPQRRLIRSKKQRMTSLWKMTQISKLKAGSLVLLKCAGHHNDGPSVALLRPRRAREFTQLGESESWSDTIHPPGTVGAGRRHGQVPVPVGTAPAPHTQAGSQGLSGTMGRD